MGVGPLAREYGDVMEDKLNTPATVGKYHPGIYDRLNSFRTARLLLARNRQHIHHLGDVFLRHGMHERFGLGLLHKRFDLFGDEHLVRSFELRHGVAYKTPTPRRMYAVPCMWRAQRGPRGQWLFYPLEFASYSEVAERRADEFETQRLFLFEIAQYLEGLGVLDVFGIATTGILALPCREDEILVEAADMRRRLLTVQAEPHMGASHDPLTETFWTFHRDGRPTEFGPAVQCRTVASVAGESLNTGTHPIPSMPQVRPILAAAAMDSM
jgi:hypothetical protein